MQCLDWREHSCIPWVVPANVVLQSRVSLIFYRPSVFYTCPGYLISRAMYLVPGMKSMGFPIFKGSALEAGEYVQLILFFTSLCCQRVPCIQQFDALPCWPMKTQDSFQVAFIVVMTS